MQNGRVTLTFQIDNVDGKTLNEIGDIVFDQLQKSGLEKVFRPLWDRTEVYDEKAISSTAIIADFIKDLGSISIRRDASAYLI